MTAQAAQNLPSTKFTRAGPFSFSSKNRRAAKTVESDEDWYIPYNGPYEPPPELPSRRRARDSWGDLLEPDDEEDMMLNDRETHLRYGGHDELNSSGRRFEEERIGRRRDRTFSNTSGQSVSSGAIDPSRPSISSNRRSTGTPQPSYVSMDTLGGVGESPIPPRRSSQERNRMSLAGIFSFNAQSRGFFTPATSRERTISGNFLRKPSLRQRSNMGTDNEKVDSKADAPGRYSSSSEHANPPVKDKHQRLHHAVMVHARGLSSDSTEAGYSNSYYATLGHDRRSESTLNHHSRRRRTHSEDFHDSRQSPSPLAQSSQDHQNSFSSRSVHPYAHAIPRNSIEGSKTPLIPTRSKFAFSSNPNDIEPPKSSFTQLASPRISKLKTSISTPDLRKSAILHDTIVPPGIPIVNFTPQLKSLVPKAKDRWLSAETWCDAVLFPRPRLKTGVLSPLGGGSGRIISPPGSPIEPHSTGLRELGVASRVLAHSLSLGDLNNPVGLSSRSAYPHTSTHPSHERDPQTSRAGIQFTTLAQEDKAPPVPSLTEVLAQGEQLANERRAWQLQAQSSFGNKRTRSLVKARSKSSAQFGRRRGHQVQTSMDYLATQACLGNQHLGLSSSAIELHTTNSSLSRKGSQSQTTSLHKSLSKSSKSHSRSHSRGESWSKSAAKVAMSTAAICGLPSLEDEVIVLREGDVRGASLEGALRGDGTRIIRLADPVHIPIERGHPINSSSSGSTRLSRSPSIDSDAGVGFAVGTPPREDDQSDLSYHPSHPYARGGLSFSSPPSRTNRGADFAGPHPSINSDDVDISQIPDTLARHKLPPHFHRHPYAQGSTRDSYLDDNGLVGQDRSGNETPHRMKMWAQLSPGILREVLPDDLQYSPFLPQKENSLSPRAGTRDSLHINDTIGVGETLVNAARFRGRDVGIANVMPIAQVDGDKQYLAPEFGPRTIRQPIEHDFEDSDALPKSSVTNRVISVSPEQHSPPPLLPSGRAASTSSSSPPLTPRRLGSPNDLEGFQDLFYRPNNELRRTPNEPALPDTPSPTFSSPAPWNSNKMQNPKTESSLTSLARQLSAEFKQITRGERTNSQHSSVPSSTLQQSSGISKRPTATSLEFVFEEVSQLGLGTELPEDVESSRASSVIERADESDDDDDTAMLRVGIIEPILTPASVSSSHRHSYAGEASGPLANEGQPALVSRVGVSSEARARILSSLQPPPSELTRSSYMTTSTVSRMSGLSDFPSPPKDHHMSYFNEPLGDMAPSSDQQVCFGRNQNAGDLAKTLSSIS